MYNYCACLKYGVYGEVVNTLDCGSSTRRFDPCYTPQLSIIKGLRALFLLIIINKAVNIRLMSVY